MSNELQTHLRELAALQATDPSAFASILRQLDAVEVASRARAARGRNGPAPRPATVLDGAADHILATRADAFNPASRDPAAATVFVALAIKHRAALAADAAAAPDPVAFMHAHVRSQIRDLVAPPAAGQPQRRDPIRDQLIDRLVAGAESETRNRSRNPELAAAAAAAHRNDLFSGDAARISRALETDYRASYVLPAIPGVVRAQLDAWATGPMRTESHRRDRSQLDLSPQSAFLAAAMARAPQTDAEGARIARETISTALVADDALGRRLRDRLAQQLEQHVALPADFRSRAAAAIRANDRATLTTPIGDQLVTHVTAGIRARLPAADPLQTARAAARAATPQSILAEARQRALTTDFEARTLPAARALNPLGPALLGEAGFRNRVHSEIAAGRHDAQIAQNITIDAAMLRATDTARQTLIASLQSAAHTPGGTALIDRVRSASLADTLAIAAEIQTNPTALARTIVRGEALVPSNAARIGAARTAADIRTTLNGTISAARSTAASGSYASYAPASCTFGDTHDGTRVHCTARAHHPSSPPASSKGRRATQTSPIQ